MSGKPIKIPVDVDTGDSERNLDKVADGFDDVASSLDKVSDASRDTDRGMGKVEDAASDAARKIDRDLTDALEDAAAASKRSSRKIGDNVKDGTDKASRASEDFKDEAKQNFSEVASSFSGDMDSAVDLVQGTLGGLASSIDAPAGVGAALGGLAIVAGAFYQKWKESSEKTKQAFSEMYDDMVESGHAFLSESFIQEQVKQIITGGEDAAESFDNVKAQAELAGVSVATMLRAWAGDAEAVAEVQAGLTGVLDENTRARADLLAEEEKSGEINQAKMADINAESEAVETLTEKLGKSTDNREKATAAAQVGREAMKATAETARDAADAESAYDTAMKDASKTNRDAAATQRSKRDAVLEAIDAAEDYTKALRENGESAETVADAQSAMYAELVKLAEQSGLSEKEARDLVNTFTDFPKEIETGVMLDDAEAKRRLDAIEKATYSTTLNLDVNGDGIVDQIDAALRRRTFVLNAVPRVGSPVPV